MKVIIGGSLGMKLSMKPYENVDINATFMYEDSPIETLTDEEIEAFNEKINKQLEEQLKKKANIAFKVYKEAIDKLKKINGN